MSAPSGKSFSMILVEDRAWTRRVPELDLWCDDREVPIHLPDIYEQWWGGIYLRQSPEPEEGEPAELVARVALAIGDGRMTGIMSPYEATEPARWFSIALADLLVVEVIARHLTTRPRKIHVRVPGWSLVLVGVSRHDGSTEWPDHERGLLKALGGPTPWPRRWIDIWCRLSGLNRMLRAR